MARQRPVRGEIAVGVRGFAHLFANQTIERYSG
jgi:hypothetical protein